MAFRTLCDCGMRDGKEAEKSVPLPSLTCPSSSISRCAIDVAGRVRVNPRGRVVGDTKPIDVGALPVDVGRVVGPRLLPKLLGGPCRDDVGGRLAARLVIDDPLTLLARVRVPFTGGFAGLSGSPAFSARVLRFCSGWDTASHGS